MTTVLVELLAVEEGDVEFKRYTVCSGSGVCDLSKVPSARGPGRATHLEGASCVAVALALPARIRGVSEADDEPREPEERWGCARLPPALSSLAAALGCSRRENRLASTSTSLELMDTCLVTNRDGFKCEARGVWVHQYDEGDGL